MRTRRRAHDSRRPPRHAAPAGRRLAPRHRAPAAARRTQGAIRDARLLRRVGPRARAQPGAVLVDQGKTDHRRALGDVRAALSRRDEASGGESPDRAACGALGARELFRRLLLRRRIPLPPLAVARAAQGGRCMFAVTLGVIAMLQATTQTGFLDRTVSLAGKSFHYQVYVPADYATKPSWPAILFLHGAGERGTDGLVQTNVGLGAAIRQNASRYPAIVVFPQVPPDSQWVGTPADVAVAALQQTLREFHVDQARVYLTGLSMGGHGTWYVVYRHPELFAGRPGRQRERHAEPRPEARPDADLDFPWRNGPGRKRERLARARSGAEGRLVCRPYGCAREPPCL